MNRLEYGFKILLDRNRDGSHATQANRATMLRMFARELKELGFKPQKMRPSDLKGRHIKRLIAKWQNDGLSPATIKNRMSTIRWWSEKVGNPGVVNSNDDYGIDNRVYVSNRDKSISIREHDLNNLSSHVRQSVELQAAFGLRREESMKFQPSYALRGQDPRTATKIYIKGTWAKGGRAREIPIFNDNQRQQLINTIKLAGSGSLIPEHKTYKAHLATFEKETNGAGIGKTHGLRHLYAQERYKQLTGFDCPVGSEPPDSLTEAQKMADLAARERISQELGHNRINITSSYLGSWSKKG